MNSRVLAFVLSLLVTTIPALAQLTAVDVQTIINQAVTRAVKISPNSVIAVTDREGYVLGVWVVRGTPTATVGEIATAVSKAGTAAYLSSNQNAFTSRTAGFIIQQHFPPGVQFTPTGPLVGVGLSNLFVTEVNRFKKIDGMPCTGTFRPCAPAFEPASAGALGSPIAFTSLDGSPGGVPVYKNGILVGGVGVTGDGTPQPAVHFDVDLATAATLQAILPKCLRDVLGIPDPPAPVTELHGIARDENPFIFISGYDIDEDVALAGQKGYTPSPTITANNVFINGIRLPYVVPPPKSKRARNVVLQGNADANFPIQGAPAPFPYPVATFGWRNWPDSPADHRRSNSNANQWSASANRCRSDGCD